MQTAIEKTMQIKTLEKILKLTPEFRGVVFELIRYDEYWLEQ